MSSSDTNLTWEYLRAYLAYNRETGLFYSRKTGKELGTLDKRGYFRISVKGKYRFAHRLAWFYEFGCWPAEILDHANRVTTDNRLVNLREANARENTVNRRSVLGASCSYKGVTFHKQCKKWQAAVQREGKNHYLGLFGTPEAARDAYNEAAVKLHGVFAISVPESAP